MFNVNGYKIYPRMFLITDGRATPGGMIAGPDHCSADEMDIVRRKLSIDSLMHFCLTSFTMFESQVW